MSFYAIKDRDERDATIKEYLAYKDRLKKRNMDERIADTVEREDMYKLFRPVLQSNDAMANKITMDLVPIRNELETLNETIRNRDMQNRIQQGSPRHLPYIPPRSSVLPPHNNIAATTTPTRPRSQSDSQTLGYTAAAYLKKGLTEGSDTVTGIRYQNDGKMMIGDKEVEIPKGSDLKIDDQNYSGTAGLWSLLTEKDPKRYTQEDLANYKDIIIKSNALYRNYDPNSPYPRGGGGAKWKRILRPIWREIRGDDNNNSGEEEAGGSGIFRNANHINELSRRYKADPNVRNDLINELIKYVKHSV